MRWPAQVAADEEPLFRWLGREIPPGGLSLRVLVWCARTTAGMVPRECCFERFLFAGPRRSTCLGGPPGDPGQHEEWLRHIAVIAAYRDQQQISTDDPARSCAPTRTMPRRHRAYWHAAHSVLTARQLARLDQAHSEDHGRLAEEDERASIAAAMAGQLGPLWLGHPSKPDEDAAGQTAYPAMESGG